MASILLIFFMFFQGPDLQKPGDALPDPETFLEKVQENLRSDYLLQSRYTFNVRQSKFEPDKDGKPEAVEVNEYEVYPSLDPEYIYRRNISKNGRPLSAEDISKQDLEHEKKLKDLEKKLEKEDIDIKTYRLEMEESRRLKEKRIIGELTRLWDISITGRDTIEGRQAIGIEFKPRPDYEPSDQETKILSKLAGRAWFCEQDYQLMRAETEFVDDLNFGWGLLARLHKGTSIVLERRYINNEIWMPAEVRVEGTARMLLLKKIRIHSVNEFYNYKKYSVTSSLSFHGEE